MPSSYLSNENDATFFKDSRNNGYVSIELDPHPESPRAYLYGLGTFLTWERRYMSPDANHYASPEDFVASLLGEEAERECRTMGDVLAAFDEAGYAICGIYRLEHGQARYELGEANPFGDPWDSGPVGFAFVSLDTLHEERMTKEEAIAYMEGEMAEYNAFVNGEVYLVTEYDEQGEETARYTRYGLDDMQAEFPSIEEIDLKPYGSLKEYVEHCALGDGLTGERALQSAMKQAKSLAAEKNLGDLHASKDRKPPEMGR